MGCPRSLVNHDLVRAVSEDMLRNRLLSTVTQWQRLLEPNLSFLYARARNTTVVEERELHESVLDATHKIQFVKRPTCSVADLEKAYQQGCITFEAYQRMFAAACGFDSDDIDTKATPPPRAEPRTTAPAPPASAPPPTSAAAPSPSKRRRTRAKGGS